MDEQVAFRYDSRLDPEFFAALLPGGPLAGLVGYARANYPADVHLRRDWMSGSQHVSLFVGLNRVLDVEYRRGRVRLNPLRALRAEFGFDPDWTTWAPLPASWPVALELFLDQAVPWASDLRGAMGAGIAWRSHAAAHPRWVIGQAFGVQFRDAALRKQVFAAVTDDLRAALDPSPIDAVPNPLKLETSALYVDAAGDLLVTEAQSRRASELPWAAAITIANARVLRMWLDHDPLARDILATTVRARVALGLLPADTPLPGRDCAIRPVVQAQAGISAKLRANIALVWAQLAERGVPEAPQLRLLEWSLSGREVLTRQSDLTVVAADPRARPTRREN